MRIDAPWGSAQIMGAVHDASGSYYGTTTNTGNPSNAVGWAVGGGAKINTPSIGAGDYFQFEVNYSEGASGYVNNGAVTYLMFNGGTGGNFGFGLMSDSVYGGLGRRWHRYQHPADHLVGRQRGLRASLEPALADVGLRRLHRHELQLFG